MEKSRRKVYLGLSGGVDSAVSAAILKKQGYDVTCVYMKCWDKGSGCTASRDMSDAAKVASFLDLPFQVWDFVNDYKINVLDSFIKSYLNGLTPNPDVLCNSEIKFGSFYKRVKNLDPGALIATGHYARIINLNGNKYLRSGLDANKDQSYFLHLISTSFDILNNCLFPIGEMEKTEVRNYAKSLELPNMNRPDSQGLCFIGDVNMRQFLSNYIGKMKGLAVNLGGELIGEHIGLSFYTIGQRHGFSLSKYHGEPLYVIGKLPQSNTLVLGSRDEAYFDEIQISGLLFIENFKKSDLSVRIRNLGKNIPCFVNFDKGVSDVCDVKLKVFEFGIAPGQSAVFYDKDIVVGGGIITKVNSSKIPQTAT